MADLVIPIGIPTKEAKAEIGIHPVIIEPKIRNCSTLFWMVQTFFTFYASIHFDLFFSVK